MSHGSSALQSSDGINLHTSLYHYLNLNIDRNSCGVIIFQTFIVTRGYDNGDYLSSTELLGENSAEWIYSGELPTPRDGLRGANIDQRVVMTGNK